MEAFARTTAATADWTGQADTLLVVHYGVESTVSVTAAAQVALGEKNHQSEAAGANGAAADRRAGLAGSAGSSIRDDSGTSVGGSKLIAQDLVDKRSSQPRCSAARVQPRARTSTKSPELAAGWSSLHLQDFSQCGLKELVYDGRDVVTVKQNGLQLLHKWR